MDEALKSLEEELTSSLTQGFNPPDAVQARSLAVRLLMQEIEKAEASGHQTGEEIITKIRRRLNMMYIAYGPAPADLVTNIKQLVQPASARASPAASRYRSATPTSRRHQSPPIPRTDFMEVQEERPSKKANASADGDRTNHLKVTLTTIPLIACVQKW